MLLDEKGLDLSAFDPILGDILGNKKGEEGGKILIESFKHGHSKVELRDWLYCLAKAPGTSLRKALIDAPGQDCESFVNGIEQGYDTEKKAEFSPGELTSETVATAVKEMLELVETLLRDHERSVVDGDLLTFALLEKADEQLKDSLEAWHTSKGLEAFRRQIKPQKPPQVALFDEKGRLNDRVFSPGGLRLCRQLREDIASMGVQKATTRHMLYTLLGKETGPLVAALSASGIDVKKDLHAVLSRELVHLGRKRNDDFELTRNQMFNSVVSVLEESQKLAQQRDHPKVTETDIHMAFVNREGREISRLFTKDIAVDLSTISNYMADSDVGDVEIEPPLQRYTIDEIKTNINETIFGQQQAVEKILPWIRRLRFGIPRDGRPAGVFLFLGPTGTGKTQLAKELARYVFGDEDMMIFLEMGQFHAKESITMFIGASPGYVGYGEGKLTNGLRDRPECVVLFDEIEKANEQVFDALLRFADEGLISDPAGPIRDGRKCIIVMTTNAGQTWLRSHLQNNPEARNEPESLSRDLFSEAMKELQAKGFRPEFLGRVDERITFLPFSIPTCRQIVDGILDKEITKFKEIKHVNIEVPEAVRQILAQITFDRSIEEGARGAPRAVNEFIVSEAIRVICDYEEEHERLPETVEAIRKGMTLIEIRVVE